jgi:aspartate-semialdehyde dehydrogenase
MEKVKIGVLGATGVVGQNYIKLLTNHPWFKIADVAASPRSAGKKYSEAVKEKWQMPVTIPNDVKDLMVRDVQDFNSLNPDISFVFSAMDLPDKEDTRAIEFKYAKKGIPVISNSSANRWIEDVPVLIPEINHDHINVIPIQQKNHGIINGGFVTVKPNCSLQSFLIPMYAIEKAGYKIDKVIVTAFEAISGSGYPGIPSLDIIDNIFPLRSEEIKSETEPLKILGKIGKKGIENYNDVEICATCMRVPVNDGHTSSVTLKFKDKVPSREEILKIWSEFKSEPQNLDLPFAPKQPIIYIDKEDRPQPKKDRNNDKGMAVTAGRLRESNVFDFKFMALSHNTIRGAAGGGILNAELLMVKGFIK